MSFLDFASSHSDACGVSGSIPGSPGGSTNTVELQCTPVYGYSPIGDEKRYNCILLKPAGDPDNYHLSVSYRAYSRDPITGLWDYYSYHTYNVSSTADMEVDIYGDYHTFIKFSLKKDTGGYIDLKTVNEVENPTSGGAIPMSAGITTYKYTY